MSLKRYNTKQGPRPSELKLSSLMPSVAQWTLRLAVNARAVTRAFTASVQPERLLPVAMEPDSEDRSGRCGSLNIKLER